MQGNLLKCCRFSWNTIPQKVCLLVPGARSIPQSKEWLGKVVPLKTPTRTTGKSRAWHGPWVFSAQGVALVSAAPFVCVVRGPGACILSSASASSRLWPITCFPPAYGAGTSACGGRGRCPAQSGLAAETETSNCWPPFPCQFCMLRTPSRGVFINASSHRLLAVFGFSSTSRQSQENGISPAVGHRRHPEFGSCIAAFRSYLVPTSDPHAVNLRSNLQLGPALTPSSAMYCCGQPQPRLPTGTRSRPRP